MAAYRRPGNPSADGFTVAGVGAIPHVANFHIVADSRVTDAVVRLLVQAGDDSDPEQLRNDVQIAAR